MARPWVSRCGGSLVARRGSAKSLERAAIRRANMATSSTADPERVLVVLAPGEDEDSALAHARQIVEESGAELTVAALAPQDTGRAGCVVGTTAYNQAVRDDAAGEIEHAQQLLGALDPPARFKLLVGGRDPDLPTWAAEQAFDLILLCARRRLVGARTRRLARGLRRATQADVRTASGSA